MASSLPIYEEMGALSSRMVDAARAGEWERLVELELAMGGLRDTLMTNGDDPGGLDAAGLERQAGLVRRILADCEEVRQLTEPWMDHVRQLLGDAVSRHRIAHAYGLK